MGRTDSRETRKDASHAAWPPRCKKLGRLLCAGYGPHMLGPHLAFLYAFSMEGLRTVGQLTIGFW